MAKTPEHYLGFAKKHLEKVQTAATDPTDWDDLTTYGLYCLEACVVAAALAKELDATKEPHWQKAHWKKANLARDLCRDHGLPDIRLLVEELNDGRKANAYGDDEFDESDYDAQDIESQIENYFNRVSSLV